MEERPNRILLSFVVPCYNAEKYIQKCLDSIFSCGLDVNSYEVVCVDDGSTDGTSGILKDNCESHFNMRVITHLMNKGWGGPRNTGIKEAAGLYVWFVDSDDMVRGNVSSALTLAVEEKLDVLCFNYDRVDGFGNQLSRQLVFQKIPSCDGYDFAKTAFNGGLVSHLGYVWRFLYKTEYLRSHGLSFPENVCWEDTVFMPRSILDAERVSAIPDLLYAYRVNQQSVSGVFSRIYPAQLIYDFAFCAGKDLLVFSEEVKDNELSFMFRDAAIHKYINGFAVHLFRTSKVERYRFYDLIREGNEEIKPLRRYMGLFNRMLLMPKIGPVIAEILSFVYKKKNL